MFHTELCDLLGIQYPIIQGAMGGVSGPPLVAAVSNAGGLGVLASFGLSSAQLHDWIRETRALTDKPFAVNIFAAEAGFIETVTKVIIEERITLVTTGRGDPRQPIVSMLKEHGIIVLPVVPTVRHALRLEAEGADAIIASGTEAGGHIGTIATLPLIPQVVDAVKVPVVAAGGIGDARGFVAALALGACGVQIGTRFLATHESGASLKQKERVLEATEEDAVPASMFTGRDVRGISTPAVEEWLRRQREGAPLVELNVLAEKAIQKRRSGEEVSVAAGQICGMIETIESAGDVIKGIIEEAAAICERVALLPRRERP